MAVFPVDDAAYPSPKEVRDLLLADLFFGAALQGVEINVLPGSDNFIRAEAYANVCAIAIANNQRSLSALLPTTATSDDLVNLAAVFGVHTRPASQSSGYVAIESSGTVTIPALYQATAPNGLKYQTVTTNTAANGGKVLLQSVGTGSATQLASGTKVRWDSAAVGVFKPTATLDNGEIDGGVDADNEETLRRRLLNRLAFPGVGGNPAMVIQLAENASAGVEYAFVYPAVRGPGSYDVAITIDGGDRAASTLLQSQVAGAVLAELPGHTSLNLTTVNAQYVDVIFEMTVPLPKNAGGVGGGFRDQAPWPAEITKVTAISDLSGSPATITVNATAAPVVGQAIGIWDAVEEEMREFIISSVSGPSGAYVIGTQGGFTGAKASPPSYISVGAFSLTLYATEALAQFNALGPGEKTDNVDILPRGRRVPGPDTLAPSNIGSRIKAAIQNKFSELEIEYAARYQAGTTTPIIGPSLPPTTADPPRIIAIKQIAFIAPT